MDGTQAYNVEIQTKQLAYVIIIIIEQTLHKLTRPFDIGWDSNPRPSTAHLEQMSLRYKAIDN